MDVRSGGVGREEKKGKGEKEEDYTQSEHTHTRAEGVAR